MKYIVRLSLLMLLMAIISTKAFSQDDYFFAEEEYEDILFQTDFGVTALYRGGINSNIVLVGRQSQPGFAPTPDAYFTGTINLTREYHTKLAFDIGYQNFNFKTKDTRNDLGNVYSHNFGYLAFGSSLIYKDIIFGFNYLSPLSGKSDGRNGAGAKLDTDILNDITELKIGYRYKIFDDETATLFVNAVAGYSFVGIYKNYELNDPVNFIIADGQRNPNGYNPRVASVAIGFSYLFKIKLIRDMAEGDSEE